MCEKKNEKRSLGKTLDGYEFRKSLVNLTNFRNSYTYRYQSTENIS